MTALLARQARPRVGFDLDLTLIDTRAASALAAESVNESLGTAIDVAEFVRRLGPPIRSEFSRWVHEELIDQAVDQFRAYFTGPGVALLQPLPGAQAALREVALREGTSIVITSRRQLIAETALSACRLVPDIVVGGLTGVEKGPAIRRHSAKCYVGDHPLDMAGAVAAGVPGVGVTSGSHSVADLRAAGAAEVLPSLLELGRLFSGRRV